MKSTRRDLALAALFLPSAAATPQNPAAPQSPPAKEDLLESARGQLRANSKQLAAFPVALALEPSFQFKA